LFTYKNIDFLSRVLYLQKKNIFSFKGSLPKKEYYIFFQGLFTDKKYIYFKGYLSKKEKYIFFQGLFTYKRKIYFLSRVVYLKKKNTFSFKGCLPTKK